MSSIDEVREIIQLWFRLIESDEFDALDDQIGHLIDEKIRKCVDKNTIRSRLKRLRICFYLNVLNNSETYDYAMKKTLNPISAILTLADKFFCRGLYNDIC